MPHAFTKASPKMRRKRHLPSGLSTIIIVLILLSYQSRVIAQSGDGQGGVAINAVRAHWPAHRAGLETGDIVRRYNGELIITERQFLDAVSASSKQRQAVRLTVRDWRTGQANEFAIVPSGADGKLGIYYTFSEPAIVGKVKAVLKRHRFSPDSFPKGEYDPNLFDPAGLVVTWAPVRRDLEALFHSEIGIGYKPKLPLLIVTDNDSKRSRIAMPSSSPAINEVLKQALQIPDATFLTGAFQTHSVSVTVGSLSPAYQKKDGEIDFGAIERVLLKFDKPGVLKLLSMSPIRREGQYVYVRSPWKQSASLATDKGQYYYRLIQGVRKHSTDNGVWIIFVWFDMVWLPRSERDPDAWGRRETSNRNPDLADALTVFVSEKPQPTTTVKQDDAGAFVPGTIIGTPAIKGDVASLAKESSLLKVAVVLLDQTVAALCGSTKKK